MKESLFFTLYMHTTIFRFNEFHYLSDEYNYSHTYIVSKIEISFLLLGIFLLELGQYKLKMYFIFLKSNL